LAKTVLAKKRPASAALTATAIAFG
jgi:hypothetical protein